ncbi:MAG: hypothetical protein IBJ15_00310 [Alphaproteobacteria bacterium]|nr:hypothetical protein [Alphaproteobacteria bacterium]
MQNTIQEVRERLRRDVSAAVRLYKVDIDKVAGALAIDPRTVRRILDGDRVKGSGIDVGFIQACALSSNDPSKFWDDALKGSVPDSDLRAKHGGEAVLFNGQGEAARVQSGGLAAAASLLYPRAAASGGIDPLIYAISVAGAAGREGNRLTYDEEKATSEALEALSVDVEGAFSPSAQIVLPDGAAANARIALRKIQALAGRRRIAADGFVWHDERIPIDKIASDHVRNFVSEAQSPNTDLYRWLMAGDQRDYAAVFLVRGEEATSVWLGARLAIKRENAIARNVLDRKDRPYAEMLYRHIIEATAADGPVFRRLQVAVDGKYGRYSRVAAATPINKIDGSRFVVTMVENLELLERDGTPIASATRPRDGV